MSDVWTSLGLHKWIQNHLLSVGIETPTDIQKNTIPEILKGRDCIGCAQTGSGKTACFALPILQTLSEDPFGVCALVLTPTRELATQIAEQFEAFGKSIRVKVTLIVGGESSNHQSRSLLLKPHVVIATPGRLACLLENDAEYFHFKRLKYLILDEVDALLAPGEMERDMQLIFDLIPPAERRQTLCFSATSTGVADALKNSLKPTTYLYMSDSENTTVDKLVQYYLAIPSIAKDGYLVHILKTKLGLTIEANSNGKFVTSKDCSKTKGIKQAIVFTSTIWQCHILGKLLVRLGFKCSVLHSALPQRIRREHLVKFRSCHTKILVATSLAGRGLDIPNVDLVINFSLPYTPDEYVHHVGRTARAGRFGTSITFIHPSQISRLALIEKRIDKKLDELHFEDDKEPEKLVKSLALLRKEISTTLYYDEDHRLNEKIKRIKMARKSKQK